MNPASAPYDLSASGDSRRRFLRGTIAGTVFLSFGNLSAFARPAADAHPPLQFFDQQEFALFRAIADRIIGPRPDDAPSLDIIAQRADAFLALEHPEIQEQFHLLLTLFDSAWVAMLFDLQWSSFLGMSPDAKDAYLRDWMLSPLAFRRTAFQGLKRLSLSVYYTHADSWRGIGFDGEYGQA